MNLSALAATIQRENLIGVNIHCHGDMWSCWTRRDGQGWSRSGQHPTLLEAVEASLNGLEDEGWEDLI